VLARGRGATVTGVDATEPLLAIARHRLPGAKLLLGELDDLPLADNEADAVIGINAFQFAADPRAALREAARVLAPGGRLVAGLFAAPERSESTVLHRALSTLVPAPIHVPYALSAPGALESALQAAGLRIRDQGETVCFWAYASVADTIRGLLASAGGALAVSGGGRRAAAALITEAVRPFVAADGTVRMRNVFRWVSAHPVTDISGTVCHDKGGEGLT
jgi:SAM-dependent methyltransferase